MKKADIQRDAVISPCGKYRYTLTRSWGPRKKLVFLMMNPSTADASIDDATIRKCMGFAERWNYDGIIVINLFAFRSRHPKDLLACEDPIGPENAKYLTQVLSEAKTVICAWGCEDTFKKKSAVGPGIPMYALRKGILYSLANSVTGLHMMCFGLTQGGTPRHPLMLAYSTMAVDYTP